MSTLLALLALSRSARQSPPYPLSRLTSLRSSHRLPKTKDQVISAPVRIVNCSHELFELPKAYNRRDAKGGMKSAPSLV